jgi:lipopolysaccharide transport system permease protein
MNAGRPATPAALAASLLQQRELVWQLVKRDFIGRYRGSVMGVGWSLFHPLLMLSIYTLVFSVAFKARWGSPDESKVAFAIVLFSGLIVHGFFAECINRAPDLVKSNRNYVKKVIFPLEILPVVTLCSALLHFLVSFAVLLAASLAAGVAVHGGAWLIPALLLPLVLLTLGLTWVLASLGVYLPDLSQIVGVVSTVLLFLAPVFYSADSLPAGYRELISWNPITMPVVQLRDLLLWDKPFLWSAWLQSLAVGAAVCWAGFWWFQRTRRGFADVL